MRFRRASGTAAVVGLLAVAAFAAACGGGDEENGGDSNGVATATGTATKAAGAASTGKSQTVAVSMHDNFFEPKAITVNRGDEITFEVKNEGQAIHDMHVLSSATEGKDYMSDITVQPGSTSKFTATFTKAGELKFQCDYHLPDMVGTITVQ